VNNNQSTGLKATLAVVALIGGIAGIIGFINGGVDERIDMKINSHEVQFESKQQETVNEIKTDIATLTEQGRSQQRQLDTIQQQGQHTQELVEQLIRDR